MEGLTMSIVDAFPQENMRILVSRVNQALNVQCSDLKEFARTGRHCSFVFYYANNAGRCFVRVLWSLINGKAAVVQNFKMSSEVATMNFLKQHTVIPVPTIFHYDRDEDGAVGGEWMVMEYVEGTSLRLAWPKMDPQDRQQICLQAADIWVHIINTHFPAIGSLHSSPSSPFGVEVGPMAQIPPHNAFDVAPPNILKSGPFHSISSWLSTLARQELSFVRSLPPDPQQPEYTNGALAEIEWLAHSNSFNSITNHPASSFVLEHVEFSPQNIIISNNRPFRIVSVVDWEGARVVPLWATNPHWSWWIDFWTREEIEENRHYEKLMRDRVAELSPRWSGAMGDECKAFRMLHNRCKHCTTFLDPDTNSKLYQFLFSLG